MSVTALNPTDKKKLGPIVELILAESRKST